MGRLDRLIERLRTVPPLGVDAAIGLGIFALGGLQQLVGHAARPASLGFLALAALGAGLRRTNLWAGCALVLLAEIPGLFAWNDFQPLAVMALLYTVSEHTSLASSLLALTVSCALPFVAWHHVEVQAGYRPLDDLPVFAQSIYPYLVMVWFAGRAQSRRRHIASELERGVAQLHEERERLSQTSVDAERSRIATDLHALVVRGVERMNAETRAARDLLNSDSKGSSEAVTAIESTGRATLVEMRRLVAVLRTRGGAAGPSPDEIWGGEWSAFTDAGGAQSARGEWSTRDQWRPNGRFSNWIGRWIAIGWVADSLLVVALAVLAAAEPLLVPWPLRLFPLLASIALAVLLLRRRFPLAVLAIMTVEVFLVTAFLGQGTAPYTLDRSMFVAVFTVAAFRGLWWGLGGVGAAAIAYAPLLVVRLDGNHVWGPLDLAFWSAVYLFAVVGGIAVRNARRLNAEHQDQTELLRRTRGERIRLAVAVERTRVARDLHDVVAHALTVMVVQAGAARALANKHSGRAREALAAVEKTGHEAVRELNSLVGNLGVDGVDLRESALEPEDRDVVSLVDRARDAGLQVGLLIEGQPDPSDGGLAIAVYRIVQEAMTNVRRHAPGARARVEIRYSHDGVEVEVTDTGGAIETSAAPVPGAGLGLVGIAERARLFGGEAEAGPTPEGGFRVRARLQTESVLV